MSELKPCPFCGKTVATISDAHETEECFHFESDVCPCEEFEVACSCGMKLIVCGINDGGRGASTGYFNSEEEAINAWNKRYKEDEQ